MPHLSEQAKILIVDDLQDNLVALEALVQRDDVRTYKAQSGDAALELLLQHDFALAILDVRMPGMDGFELAEYMRCTEKTRGIPIVFVSAASGETDFAFKGYEKGAVDFLYKPLDHHAVRSKVSVFLDLYRHRQTLKRQVAALETSRNEQDLLLRELRQVQGELQQAVSLRDDFMSVVSHELRSPLNTLKLELYVRRLALQSGEADAFSLQNLQKMFETDDRQIQRLVHLIDDFLDISRIRTGKLTVRRQRFDVSELVQGLADQLSGQLARANCKIEINAPAAVFGDWDEFRVEQIITNLLTNAIRYGAGKPIQIDVSSHSKGVEVAVRDQGIGIGAQDHERIFQQFERVASNRSASGLGLGLYIAEQIASAHDGTLRVESAVGEGANFILFLPFTANPVDARAGSDT